MHDRGINSYPRMQTDRACTAARIQTAPEIRAGVNGSVSLAKDQSQHMKHESSIGSPIARVAVCSLTSYQVQTHTINLPTF